MEKKKKKKKMMMMMMIMMFMMKIMIMISYPMVADLVVGSRHRETAALKLIVIYVAEIQN